MWYEKIPCGAEPIRGANVYLLPWKVPKKQIIGFFGAAASRKHPMIEKAKIKFFETLDDDELEVGNFWATLVRTVPGLEDPSTDVRYDALKGENVWLNVADSIKVAHAGSGIDGKYVFEGIKDGNYILYADCLPPGEIFVWTLAIKVSDGKPVVQDLHSSNTTLSEAKATGWKLFGRSLPPVPPPGDVLNPETSRLKTGDSAVVVHRGEASPAPDGVHSVVLMIDSLDFAELPSIEGGTRVLVISDTRKGDGDFMREISVQIQDKEHAGKLGRMVRWSLRKVE
jgi:hypothetical protein